MYCIHDKLVQTNVFHPALSFKVHHEDPWRNDEHIADQQSD